MAINPPDTEQTQQQIADMATYEELAQLEQEFDDVDCEVIRTNYRLSAPLYKKREAIISKIPSFWALVFEQAPPDLDQFITPSDSQVIAQSLTKLEITRPEVDDPNGDPRTITIKLSFKENDFFSDTTLEKTLYFRRAADNWTGHVSQPTKIHWKKGKDLTKGLTDAAYNLWQKKSTDDTQAATNGSAAKPTPEEAALRRKLETLGEESTSFFTFFAFVSERRYVSAAESAAANAAERKRRAQRAAGEAVEDVKPADDGFEEQDFEVCPHGADLGMLLVEEVWPHAIKYFITGQEDDDEEDMEDISDEDESDDEDDRVDIRALVQGKRKDKSSQSLSPVGIDKPPAKKQQKKN